MAVWTEFLITNPLGQHDAEDLALLLQANGKAGGALVSHMIPGALTHTLEARGMLTWRQFATHFWDWVVSSPAAMHILNSSRAATKEDLHALNVPGAWLADLLYTQIKQLLPPPGRPPEV